MRRINIGKDDLREFDNSLIGGNIEGQRKRTWEMKKTTEARCQDDRRLNNKSFKTICGIKTTTLIVDVVNSLI